MQAITRTARRHLIHRTLTTNTTTPKLESLGQLSADAPEEVKLLEKPIKRKMTSTPTGFRRFEVQRPYNPYDFTPANRTGPSKERRPKRDYGIGPSRANAEQDDVFYQLKINPLDEVLNVDLLSNYQTEMGRIQSRSQSKLTWKSQRQVGQAIRRARAMGLIPTYSKRDANRKPPQRK